MKDSDIDVLSADGAQEAVTDPRAALADLADAFHGLSDEPPHMYHASFRECPDHHCQKATAALSASDGH